MAPSATAAAAPAGMPAGPDASAAPRTVPATPGFGPISAAFLKATAASRTQGSPLVLEPTLLAIASFLGVFDALGSSVLTQLVATDFRWKLSAVRTAGARLKTTTAGSLVSAERKRPPGMFAASGADGLRWAHRVLRFVDALVAGLLSDPRAQPVAAATAAYRSTIGRRHGKVATALFEKGLALLPGRDVFVANLLAVPAAQRPPGKGHFAEVDEAMRKFREAAAPHVREFDLLFPGEE